MVTHLTRTEAHPRSLRSPGALSFAARFPCPIAGAAGSSRSAALRRLPRRSPARRARCDLPSTSISPADARMGARRSTWGPSEILRSRVAFVLPHLGPIHLSVDRSGVAFALQRPAMGPPPPEGRDGVRRRRSNSTGRGATVEPDDVVEVRHSKATSSVRASSDNGKCRRGKDRCDGDDPRRLVVELGALGRNPWSSFASASRRSGGSRDSFELAGLNTRSPSRRPMAAAESSSARAADGSFEARTGQHSVGPKTARGTLPVQDCQPSWGF